MLYKVKAKIKLEKMKDFFKVFSDGSIEVQEPDGTYILKSIKEEKLIDKNTIA